MKTVKEPQKFKGVVSVCCHAVSFLYWDFVHELTTELKTALTDEAESRAKELINEGYQQGELKCYYHTKKDGSDDEEIRGWWEI